VRHKTGGAAPEHEDELAEEKAQAELSLAPDLLRRLPLRGRLVTGDALYCQRALCEQIRQAHGHYLFVIKANQPALLAEAAGEQQILAIRDALLPVLAHHARLGGSVSTVLASAVCAGRGLCYEEVAGTVYRCYEARWWVRQQWSVSGGRAV